MRTLHTITLSVFCRPKEEDEVLVKEKLVAFFPFNLQQEKIKIEVQHATGFKEQPIEILSVTLQKEAHLAKFLEALLARLDAEQKQAVRRETESRLDEELFFYLRFDKQRWNERQELWIVDHGDCYHLKMRLAAYPKSRGAALKLLEKLFA